jgi:uncharacterized membrane protein
MEQVLTTPAGIPVSKVEPLKRSAYRIDSIDLLRGLVMIIMALDHTRDFFHSQAMTDDPLNLATTTPLLYFTRWITHFCAPVFVFLAGTSAYLQSLRKPKKELSLFLIKRGLWLLAVEVFLISLGITFDISYSFIILQTIWAIGISMIVLGLAIWMPFTAILVTGLAIVFGHNLLDFYEAKHQGAYPLFYSFLHRPDFLNLGGNHLVQIAYPFLSWAGLMMTGYCLGKVFHTFQGAERRKVLTAMGLAAILLFVAVRATNAYGDPDEWSTQKNGLFTFLSFMNVHKYPPSLLYMLITIGPALLFLAWAGNAKTRLAKIITVYGRVPFFYYVLHFYLLHLATAAFFLARGHSFAEGAKGLPNFPFKFLMPGEGYPLWVVYVVWISAVALLYPVCKWFSEYKKTHSQWWLSYL